VRKRLVTHAIQILDGPPLPDFPTRVDLLGPLVTDKAVGRIIATAVIEKLRIGGGKRASAMILSERILKEVGGEATKVRTETIIHPPRKKQQRRTAIMVAGRNQPARHYYVFQACDTLVGVDRSCRTVGP
jgi:hypothetical protein